MWKLRTWTEVILSILTEVAVATEVNMLKMTEVQARNIHTRTDAVVRSEAPSRGSDVIETSSRHFTPFFQKYTGQNLIG